ncbi:MAG: Uma2 family endonuclease [Steroidobacteraceae bacterium]
MMTISLAEFQADSTANLAALREAVRKLTRFQREELAEWMLNSPDLTDAVAEFSSDYGPPGGRRPRTVEEFLRMEQGSPVRHEYVGGEIFDMRAPMPRHEVIVGNLLDHFRAQLGVGPSKVIASDLGLRLQVDDCDLLYRPDLMVACGPLTAEALDLPYLTEPCVIVEVFSPVTEDIDRREKLLNYRRIASVEEYVVVAQRSLEVIIFRRSDNWNPTVLTTPDDVLESRSVGVSISLEEVYEGTR